MSARSESSAKTPAPKGSQAGEAAHEPPRVVARRTIHTGRKFEFQALTVELPSGKSLVRDVVHHPGAAVIVPVLPDGRLVLTRVYRAAIDQWLLEFPAGTLEKGEAPEKCAARELIEETGYKGASLASLGWFFTTPGMTDERMHAFVATGLTHVGQRLEEDENIVVEVISGADVARLIASGELRDGKSLVAYFHAHARGLLAPGKDA